MTNTEAIAHVKVHAAIGERPDDLKRRVKELGANSPIYGADDVELIDEPCGECR